MLTQTGRGNETGVRTKTFAVLQRGHCGLIWVDFSKRYVSPPAYYDLLFARKSEASTRTGVREDHGMTTKGGCDKGGGG